MHTPVESRVQSNRLAETVPCHEINPLSFLCSGFPYLRRFENIYVGWGLKCAEEWYLPSLPPAPQSEYLSGPEITEGLDPSLEEEQTLKATLEMQQAAQEELESLEGEEEDEDD